jgi:hypothetical protein
MKTKMLITESQYKKLLLRVNEQVDFSLGKKSVGLGLNKYDSTSEILPQSDNIAELDKIITEKDATTYLTSDKPAINKVYNKLVGMLPAGHESDLASVRINNERYYAAIIKTYLEKNNSEHPFTQLFITKKIIKTKDPILPLPTDGIPKGGSISYPVDSSPKGQEFVDNTWDFKPEFITDFKENVIDNISNKVNSVKESGKLAGKPTLKSLTIKTSCSTLPNGISPDKKVHTFEELSKLRNDAALNKVYADLKQLGVVIPENFEPVLDWKGSEGNGSTVTNGNVWGTEGSSKKRADYEQDKYLRISLDVTIPTNDGSIIQPVTDGGEKIKIVKIYNATFTTPEIERTVDIPTLGYSKKEGQPQQYCKKNPKTGLTDCWDTIKGDN